MNKRSFFPILVYMLTLVLLPLLTGCQANSNNIAVAAAVENKPDLQAVDFAFTERWQAMAHFYSPHTDAGMNLTTLSPADIYAYRWIALASFYEKHPFTGVNLTTLNANEVSAYRWLAIARFYAHLEPFNK